MKDYYSILGVSEDASQEDIKKKYRSLAMKYHPDKNPGDIDCENKFKDITEAYDTLSDESKRKKYDYIRKGSHYSSFSANTGFSANMEDVFTEFFSKNRHSSKGQDIFCQVECSFEESICGVTKPISFDTTDICIHCNGIGHKKDAKINKCDKCKGAGFISVTQHFGPNQTFQMNSICSDCLGKGVCIDKKDLCNKCTKGVVKKSVSLDIEIPSKFVYGTTLRISNQGLHSSSNSKKGDCYVRIYPKEHELFDMNENYDLIFVGYITMSEAILGTQIDIPLLDGNSKRISIPPGTNTHDKFCIDGHGLYKKSGKRGNIIVIIIVETVRHNDNISEFAKKIALEENKNNSPLTYDFRNKVAKYINKENK